MTERPVTGPTAEQAREAAARVLDRVQGDLTGMTTGHLSASTERLCIDAAQYLARYIAALPVEPAADARLAAECNCTGPYTQTCHVGNPHGHQITCPAARPKPPDDRTKAVSIWTEVLAEVREQTLREASAEANGYLIERNDWQRSISDALGMTFEDHGTQHADLPKCVEEIEHMIRQRHEGWRAAYERGLREAQQAVRAERDGWRPGEAWQAADAALRAVAALSSGTPTTEEADA